MERFNPKAVHASDLTDDIRIMVFVEALLPNSILDFKLSRNNPTSIEEMYVVAHEHSWLKSYYLKEGLMQPEIPNNEQKQGKNTRYRGTHTSGLETGGNSGS